MQGARPERQSEQSRRRALRHSFQVRSPGRLVCRGPKQRTDTRLVLGISSFCIEDGLISARTAFGKSLSALTHSEGKIRHESSIKALFRSPSPPAPPGGSVLAARDPRRSLPRVERQARNPHVSSLLSLTTINAGDEVTTSTAYSVPASTAVPRYQHRHSRGGVGYETAEYTYIPVRS